MGFNLRFLFPYTPTTLVLFIADSMAGDFSSAVLFILFSLSLFFFFTVFKEPKKEPAIVKKRNVLFITVAFYRFIEIVAVGRISRTRFWKFFPLPLSSSYVSIHLSIITGKDVGFPSNVHVVEITADLFLPPAGNHLSKQRNSGYGASPCQAPVFEACYCERNEQSVKQGT